MQTIIVSWNWTLYGRRIIDLTLEAVYKMMLPHLSRGTTQFGYLVDVDDLNLYCKYLYRCDMEQVHQMDLNKINSNIQSDPEDFNSYCCKACREHYRTREYSRHHIRLLHPSTKLETI